MFVNLAKEAEYQGSTFEFFLRKIFSQNYPNLNVQIPAFIPALNSFGKIDRHITLVATKIGFNPVSSSLLIKANFKIDCEKTLFPVTPKLKKIRNLQVLFLLVDHPYTSLYSFLTLH